MKKNLPTTFRVTGSRKEAQLLLEVIKSQFLTEYVKAVAELYATDDVKVEPPQSLPWYPGEFAWQLDLTRKDIRRSEQLFRLHNFLIAETNSGNISRQEAVSMLPPLLLDVQPHHKILDMCAAPGSKTAQIIESLHENVENALPQGFVIANDLDNRRCYMLVHQSKRLNSPACLITNIDSTNFPNLKMTNEDGTTEALKFDRILCDVPCSSDGTLRKNPDMWTKWQTMQAIHLNGLQYRIVKRGLELLSVGGKLVYSTCSLNPIENEAVVARILQESEGAVELLDVQNQLPELKHSSGLETWKACMRDMVFYDKFDDVPEKHQSTLRPYMFPPPAEKVKELNLTRCIRILPQQQNTGAFFVAVFEKKGELPWTPREPQPQIFETKDSVEPPRKRKKNNYGFREDPFVFFTKEEPVFTSLKNFYQIRDDFDPRCLLTRCATGKKKHLYFCTPAIRNVVVNNESIIKIVNTGVKTFSRCEGRNVASCEFRLAQEGLANIHHLLGDGRRLIVDKEDMIHLLKNLDPDNAPQIEQVSTPLKEQLNKLDSGSCILTYSDDRITLNMAGWKGVRSIRAYTEVNDAVHTLRLLGADVSQYGKSIIFSCIFYWELIY